MATVIDCHTREVIGWAMDDHYRTPLIEEAIRMAATNHRLAAGAIFHSDRGSNPRFNWSLQRCFGSRVDLRSTLRRGSSSRESFGAWC